MKKYFKGISLLLILLFISTVLISTLSFAAFDAAAIKSAQDGIKQNINTQVAGETDIQNVAGKVIWALKYVGFILGTILVIWFGIKWMTSSPNDRAALKDQSWNYVIGAVLLFGAIPLASWIYNMVDTMNK